MFEVKDLEQEYSERHSFIQEDFITKSINHIHTETLEKILQALLREQILDHLHEKDNLIFSLPRTKKQLVIEKLNLGTMDRYLGFRKVSLVTDKTTRNLDDPKYLIKLLSNEFEEQLKQDQWIKLELEIENHINNALFTYQKSFLLAKKIKNESKKLNIAGFLDWLESNSEIKNKQVYIEQWACQGHPLHPCSKTKLGFSLQDVIKYAPEFHSEVKLLLAAVNKNYVHIESLEAGENYSSWFSQTYPETWREFVKKLQDENLALDDYIPLPIHPWQREHHIHKLFSDLIDSKIINIFEQVQIKATPTLSFRTLAPVRDVFAPHIKLPIAVQATSVFRTLGASSTVNTPRISKIMKQILEKENYFDHRINSVHEQHGLHLKNIDPDKAKHLTTIFRENPNLYLTPNENAIVVAALFEKSPITGLPLFIELMHQANYIDLNQAIEYFTHYCDLALGSYLDLYLLYGIALEGHQQNTLAVFENGKIKKFIARDLDGTSLHDESLKRHGINFDPYPNSANVETKDQVRKSLLHTTYQSHLGELVILLLKYFECEADLFWNVIKKVTEQRFLKLKSRMEPKEWEEEYQKILVSNWPCKALLRMRMLKDYNPEGLFFEINNPLNFEKTLLEYSHSST